MESLFWHSQRFKVKKLNKPNEIKVPTCINKFSPAKYSSWCHLSVAVILIKTVNYFYVYSITFFSPLFFLFLVYSVIARWHNIDFNCNMCHWHYWASSAFICFISGLKWNLFCHFITSIQYRINSTYIFYKNNKLFTLMVPVFATKLAFWTK